MPNTYFIAYALSEDAGAPIDALRQRIAEKFGVSGARAVPPHLTFFNSFTMDPEKEGSLIAALHALAKDLTPVDISFFGFDEFAEERVWFLKPAQDPALYALRAKIVNAVAESVSVPDPRPHGHVFHVTLSYKDVSQENHVQIGEMLRNESLPAQRATVDSLTLFSRKDGEVTWRALATATFGA